MVDGDRSNGWHRSRAKRLVAVIVGIAANVIAVTVALAQEPELVFERLFVLRRNREGIWNRLSLRSNQTPRTNGWMYRQVPLITTPRRREARR